jgi:hypothetical protein
VSLARECDRVGIHDAALHADEIALGVQGDERALERRQAAVPTGDPRAQAVPTTDRSR